MGLSLFLTGTHPQQFGHDRGIKVTLVPGLLSSTCHVHGIWDSDPDVIL